MGKLNWKKILVFGTIGALTPALGQWSNCFAGSPCPPFTAGNVIIPAIPTVLAMLAALFSNPRYRP